MPPTETRIHLACHFPNHSSEQQKAFSVFLTYLLSRRDEDDVLRITGFTQADGLIGQWWSDFLGGWVEDNITIITIDLLGDENDWRFVDAIVDLKNYAHECYEDAGDPQDEIWITTHALTRYRSM